MTISVGAQKVHWNYFLALEQDVAAVSRYVEFPEANFGTFSVELAHLLLAAASEVDVLAKRICGLVAPGDSRFAPEARSSINDYRDVLVPAYPTLSRRTVFVPRYE